MGLLSALATAGPACVRWSTWEGAPADLRGRAPTYVVHAPELTRIVCTQVFHATKLANDNSANCSVNAAMQLFFGSPSELLTDLTTGPNSERLRATKLGRVLLDAALAVSARAGAFDMTTLFQHLVAFNQTAGARPPSPSTPLPVLEQRDVTEVVSFLDQFASSALSSDGGAAHDHKRVEDGPFVHGCGVHLHSVIECTVCGVATSCSNTPMLYVPLQVSAANTSLAAEILGMLQAVDLVQSECYGACNGKTPHRMVKRIGATRDRMILVLDRVAAGAMSHEEQMQASRTHHVRLDARVCVGPEHLTDQKRMEAPFGIQLTLSGFITRSATNVNSGHFVAHFSQPGGGVGSVSDTHVSRQDKITTDMECSVRVVMFDVEACVEACGSPVPPFPPSNVASVRPSSSSSAPGEVHNPSPWFKVVRGLPVLSPDQEHDDVLGVGARAAQVHIPGGSAPGFVLGLPSRIPASVQRRQQQPPRQQHQPQLPRQQQQLLKQQQQKPRPQHKEATSGQTTRRLLQENPTLLAPVRASTTSPAAPPMPAIAAAPTATKQSSVWTTASSLAYGGVDRVIVQMPSDRGGSIALVRGTLVNFNGSCIINAANKGGVEGEGVDGAINRAGGAKLLVERSRLPVTNGVRIPTRYARVTAAHGSLKVPWIVHAVGPNFAQDVGDCDALLRSAYDSAIELAVEKGASAVGSAILSGGVFRGTRTLEDVVSIAVVELVRVVPNAMVVLLFAFNDDEERAFHTVFARLTAPRSMSHPRGRGDADSTEELRDPTHAAPARAPAPEQEARRAALEAAEVVQARLRKPRSITAVVGTADRAVRHPLAPGRSSTATAQDLARLDSGQWLNDTVIVSYAYVMQGRSPRSEHAPYVFAPNMWTLLETGDVSRLDSWTGSGSRSRVNLFAGHPAILFFVHRDQNHWALAVAHVQQQVITYHDPLGLSGDRQLQLIRAFLSRHHELRCNKPLPGSWRVLDVRETPRQVGGNDCGVFVLMMADVVITAYGSNPNKDWGGCPLVPPLSSFSMAQVPAARRMILEDILVSSVEVGLGDEPDGDTSSVEVWQTLSSPKDGRHDCVGYEDRGNGGGISDPAGSSGGPGHVGDPDYSDFLGGAGGVGHARDSGDVGGPDYSGDADHPDYSGDVGDPNYSGDADHPDDSDHPDDPNDPDDPDHPDHTDHTDHTDDRDPHSTKRSSLPLPEKAVHDIDRLPRNSVVRAAFVSLLSGGNNAEMWLSGYSFEGWTYDELRTFAKALCLFIAHYEGYFFSLSNTKGSGSRASLTLRCRYRASNGGSVKAGNPCCQAHITFTVRREVNMKMTHKCLARSKKRVEHDAIFRTAVVSSQFTDSLIHALVELRHDMASVTEVQMRAYVESHFKSEHLHPPPESYVRGVVSKATTRLYGPVRPGREVDDLCVVLRERKCSFSVYPRDGPTECVVWYDPEWPRVTTGGAPVDVYVVEMDGTCNVTNGRSGLGKAVLVTGVSPPMKRTLLSFSLVTQETTAITEHILRFTHDLEHLQFAEHVVCVTDESQALIGGIQQALASLRPKNVGCHWHKMMRFSTQAGLLLGRKARQSKSQSMRGPEPEAERGSHTWSDDCVKCGAESGDSIHGVLICCDGHGCSNAFCLDCSGGPLAPSADEPFYCTTCLAKGNDDAARAGRRGGGGTQNAPRIRGTSQAWFHYVYSAPTMEASLLRMDEFFAALPGLSLKWMANLRATLKLYADAASCDKFTMEHTTDSIAEGLNRIV